MQLDEVLNIKSDVEFDIESRVSSDRILCKECIDGLSDRGSVKYSANNAQMSHIWSKIIEAAGRFTLSFSSDILRHHQSMVEEFTRDGLETKNYIFAFREQGVDGLSRLQENLGNADARFLTRYGYYRKIYLLTLHESEVNSMHYKLTLTLVDIT